MDVRSARAILFACIEGGSTFWSSEIAARGACEVVERINAGAYDPVKFKTVIAKVSNCQADQVLGEIESAGAIFLTPDDAAWPRKLDDLAAPPISLVAKGAVESLQTPTFAIVGTRNPTHYGVRMAGDFAAGFVDREWTITSGGAYGIDAAAHRGALAAEGVTIAVLASGVNVNYPAAHERLFCEIAESGLLISEVLPHARALPARFLTRNRIIAALSTATLVVEAAFRSGSLRTARDAAELLRPVMAIPGPITSPTSEGCHRLIGERVAEIVTSVADATELIGSFR